MKTKKKVSTEITPIPDYVWINRRPRCNKCKYQGNCYLGTTRSETGSKLSCKIFAKNFYTIEFIIFLIIEILGVLKIFSLDKEKLILTGIAVAYTIAIVCFEAFISKMAELISENKEIKRKANYDTKVEKIKESNEQIRRMQNGETEEYLEFIDKSKDITDEFVKCSTKLSRLPTASKYESENSEIINKFQSFTNEFKTMSKRINTKNYHSNSKLLQTLYGSYAKALLEKMNVYIELYKADKLTKIQIEEYNKLLSNFILKVNACNEKIDETEGQEILNDIRQLNNLISSDDTNL